MTITPELYEFIAKVVEDKVRDIKVAREEFDKLAAAVKDLTEAQKRTEEGLNILAGRVYQLVEAQVRNEERLGKLIGAIEALRVEVARLSDAVGFGLEDIARVVLPGWLHRQLGLEVNGLERRFVEVEGGLVEANLYGEGLQMGERVIVVGECKSRIYERDVEKFYEDVYRPLSQSPTRVVGLLFGYWIHPAAQRKAQELGLYTVAPYQS